MGSNVLISVLIIRQIATIRKKSFGVFFFLAQISEKIEISSPTGATATESIDNIRNKKVS